VPWILLRYVADTVLCHQAWLVSYYCAKLLKSWFQLRLNFKPVLLWILILLVLIVSVDLFNKGYILLFLVYLLFVWVPLVRCLVKCICYWWFKLTNKLIRNQYVLHCSLILLGWRVVFLNLFYRLIIAYFCLNEYINVLINARSDRLFHADVYSLIAFCYSILSMLISIFL
jgi:hypothetical protein